MGIVRGDYEVSQVREASTPHALDTIQNQERQLLWGLLEGTRIDTPLSQLKRIFYLFVLLLVNTYFVPQFTIYSLN